MDKVADFHNYILWNPWQQKGDKKRKQHHRFIKKTRPQKYSWKGSKRGTGSLTLREIDEHHLNTDLEFITPVKTFACDNFPAY